MPGERWVVRPRFDQIHELGAALAAVDDRRGKLRSRRDEADRGGLARDTAVAGDAELLADLVATELRLRDVEAELQVRRRQELQHGGAGTHLFSLTEVDVLDPPGNGRNDLALVERPLCGG